MKATDNGVIYLLTSPSGKQYVGQSWDYETRMVQYSRGGRKEQRVLQNAIRKYGWENFTATIIMQGIQTQDALDKTEDAFILLLDTLAPNGYNLRRGGRGGKHHADSRAKIGDAQRGKVVSAETRAKISAAKRGHDVASETRAKISASNRRRVVSAETRAKMSAAHRGEKHPLFGKKHTAESRAKMSASAKARWARSKTIQREGKNHV